jgi:16S rRNA (cytosine967-C5)-methyltransferase
MSVSPARSASFLALLLIAKESAFSSATLPEVTRDLSPRDSSLCYEIVLGTLRRQIYLDRLIDLFVSNKKLDIEVRIALRIGLFQLAFLDRVPSFSILNESVELVRKAKKTSATGLVNAVLRRASRGLEDLPYNDELDRISVQTSHPRWLIEKWTKQFGAERAASIASANNSPQGIAFRLTGRSSNTRDARAEWKKSATVSGCFSVERMSEELIELANAGEIYFQDEASQMVGSAVEVGSGGLFLDVCAAPGGKTTLISSRHREAKILVAGDLPEKRVRLLKENCVRQNAKASVVRCDALGGLPFADGTFDTILLDAPCSGTGTIRHNPEIRYTVEPEAIGQFGVKQLSLLMSASKLLRLGGKLYYSTCSLETEENEEVIKKFIDNGSDLSLVSPGLEDRFVTSEHFARTFPDRDNMDGFFLAVLKRGG